MLVAQSIHTPPVVMAVGLLVFLVVGAVVLLGGIEYFSGGPQHPRRKSILSVGVAVMAFLIGAVIFGLQSSDSGWSGEVPRGASVPGFSGEPAWVDGVPLNWMVIVAAVGALIVAQLVLRKAEAWAFWRTSWKPAGAIASAAVMAAVGGVFVTQWQTGTGPSYPTEPPSFESFVDAKFSQASGNSGYGDLLAMASSPTLSDDEARLAEIQSIGVTEDSGYFTAGHSADPKIEGVWRPLLLFDEGVRLVPDGSKIGHGELIPVSIGEPVESISDKTVLSPAADPGIRMFAVASGRFTTVAEAWDDVAVKLQQRVPLANPDGDPDDQRSLAVRGLSDATRRLAVSREPLILEDEVDGDLVQPMYRVHLAIDEAVWDEVAKPRVGSLSQSRERSIILLAVLCGMTLVFGGIAGRLAVRPEQA